VILASAAIAHPEISLDQYGPGDALDPCLLDAAHALEPLLPDITITITPTTRPWHYPLSFSVRDDHPLIMPGDANSSPLDIDAIQGGGPRPGRFCARWRSSYGSRALRLVDGATSEVELEAALAMRRTGADAKSLRRALRRIEELLDE
jgi:hypothetical protein